jgi:hypothetical protein
LAAHFKFIHFKAAFWAEFLFEGSGQAITAHASLDFEKKWIFDEKFKAENCVSAGDYVKFGFPMAGATSMLLLGLYEFKDAYESVGLLDDMLDCVKWPLDYFMKAHTSQYEFYAQVRISHGLI